MTFGAFGLAFVAGLLSVLSRCVLPLLPLVFGAAASESRAGPVALAAGVAIAFTPHWPKTPSDEIPSIRPLAQAVTGPPAIASRVFAPPAQ